MQEDHVPRYTCRFDDLQWNTVHLFRLMHETCNALLSIAFGMKVPYIGLPAQ